MVPGTRSDSGVLSDKQLVGLKENKHQSSLSFYIFFSDTIFCINLTEGGGGGSSWFVSADP